MTLETETTVDLNMEDISEIAKHMNNKVSNDDKLSQDYLEWLLCDTIRIVRNVNFFEEERKINIVEKMSRNLSIGEYDGT